jgi:hypothetical protein
MWRKRAFLFVSTAINLCLLGAVALAQNSDFFIEFDKPRKGSERLVGSAWWIYISGEIQPGAASKFEEFVVQNRVPIRSLVVLNSPGGSLYEGMELGRIIRKHRLNTDVGIRKASKRGYREYVGGGCFSSCSYAFLGGVFRYLHEGSRYGVHRFYSNTASYANSMDAAQITSAEIVSYVREMGIDPEIFTLSTKAGADSIYLPPRSLLEKLGVVNDGWTRPKWSIESIAEGVYLKGERDSQYGLNKFIMYCSNPNSMVLHIIFDTQGHQEEVRAMNAHSLVIDGKDKPIEPFAKVIENGSANILLTLSNEELTEIMHAKSVGVIVRPNYESPFFLGFNAMPFEEGAAKLVGVISACTH